MTYTLVVLASLFVASLAAPSLVEWFDIEPAKKVESPHQTLLGMEQAQIAFKPNKEEFRDFKLQFSKIYETIEEENKRFKTFVSNLEYIQEHNKKYRLGQKSFYLGINHFADMEVEEFVSYNGLAQSRLKTSDCRKFLAPNYLTLPKEVDWREKGYVTEVKDQGQCGSCWSFSATGSLEGQHFRKTGKLVSLSEQQLVDCSSDYGNSGCEGGLMDQAFVYIRDYGIESEGEYKYMAEDEKCHFRKREVKANCTGCEDVETGSEDILQKAVVSMGPISVAIDASHRSFQLYNGGVYDEEECSRKLLDHGVLCVGYGTDVDGRDYWLVKNSWSTKWGEKGYIKMARNKDNMCGIATQASFPDV